jgi:hypothetical protein
MNPTTTAFHKEGSIHLGLARSQKRSRRQPITTDWLTTQRTTHMAPGTDKDPALPKNTCCAPWGRSEDHQDVWDDISMARVAEVVIMCDNRSAILEIVTQTRLRDSQWHARQSFNTCACWYHLIRHWGSIATHEHLDGMYRLVPTQQRKQSRLQVRMLG